MIRMNDGDLDKPERVEYVRVNVSSTTCPPVYSTDGERVAEVEMRLPENLISYSGKAVKAEMKVMKLNIPLEEVPITSVKITGTECYDDELCVHNMAHYLKTDMQIALLPLTICTMWGNNLCQNKVFKGIYGDYHYYWYDWMNDYKELNDFPNRSDDGLNIPEYPVSVTLTPRNMLNDYDKIPFIEEQGVTMLSRYNPLPYLQSYVGKEYEIQHMEELLKGVNDTFSYCFRRLLGSENGPGINRGNMATCELHVTDHNTLAIRYIPPAYADVLPINKGFYDINNWPYRWVNRNGVVDRYLSFPAVWEGFDETDTYQMSSTPPQNFCICVNKQFVEQFPNLPYIPVNTRTVPVIERFDPATYEDSLNREGIFYAMSQGQKQYYWDETIYIIDTRLAFLREETIVNSRAIDVHAEPNTTMMTFHQKQFLFDFLNSEAINVSSLQSIVLTMQGVNFTEEVFPVFYESGTQALQTGTLPIIESFTPVISSVTDLKTNMVVVRTEFDTAAPINLNLSLLKERNIKFKFYYVTDDGKLKEMFLPRGSPVTFQICFKLTIV